MTGEVNYDVGEIIILPALNYCIYSSAICILRQVDKYVILRLPEHHQCNFEPAVDTCFSEYRTDMRLYRPFRNEQLFPNLAVGHALGKETCDFILPLGKTGEFFYRPGSALALFDPFGANQLDKHINNILPEPNPTRANRFASRPPRFTASP